MRSRRTPAAADDDEEPGTHRTLTHAARGDALVERRRVLLAARDVALASAALLVAPRPGSAAAEVTESSLARLLARRRMVRHFTDAPVSDAQIDRILAAAHRAPSAGNRQPWAFVVVREARTRARLARAALGQKFVADAPVVVVACADVPRATSRYERRGELYAIVDTAFASMLLLLAVTEEGLGACFVGALREHDVRAALGLPPDVKPIAVIPIGHPARRPKRSRLRPLAEIVHDERWRGSADDRR